MWHIILIGYIFVTMMFSIAQPGWARMLIYLTVFTILPTVFAFWVAIVRKRNKRMKQERQQKHKSLPE